FTGRPARALVNDFVREFDPVAVDAYPAVHHLTKEFRAESKKADDPHGLHLWAGTGHRNAAEGSAETIVKDLGGRFPRAADSHRARGFHDAADSHEARGSHDPDPVLGQQRPGPAEFAVVGEETPLVAEIALLDECSEPLEGSFALDGGPAAFAQFGLVQSGDEDAHVRPRLAGLDAVEPQPPIGLCLDVDLLVAEVD